MEELLAKDIVHPTKTAAPEDTIAKVVEIFRSYSLDALPVVAEDKLVGIITEEELLGILPTVLEDADRVRTQRVKELMRREFMVVDEYTPVQEITSMFEAHDIKILPVLDVQANYMGVITRADLVGFISRLIRPRRIGGMATPLGVYLTTGNYRAGSSDFGLFLTGVVLALLGLLAFCLVGIVAWFVQAFWGFPLLDFIMARGALYLEYHRLHIFIVSALQIFFFFTLIRLCPLTGYHAAEHQVVHAIERGEELSAERVRQMPRTHQRCGTNLLVPLIVLQLLFPILPTNELRLLALFIALMSWRFLGAPVQEFFTTKPATQKQLFSGIKAGSELLTLYHSDPTCQVSRLQKLWNMGLLQVLIGFSLTLGLSWLVAYILRLPFILF